MIWVERIECALHERVFSLRAKQDARCWHGVFLATGSGSLQSADEVLEFRAPALIWTPTVPDLSFRMGAGSDCIHLTITLDTLSNAISTNAEASEMWALSERRLAVQLTSDEAESDCKYTFDMMLREAQNRETGGHSMLEAQARAMLVLLWRNTSAPAGAQNNLGRVDTILHRFRQLVESHFRDQWSIGQYAAAIDVTPDRLHDICKRNLGRSPSQLVQERVLIEAQQMLENTALPLAKISNTLGFHDANYFNRFFRKKTGTPPATYRRLGREALGRGSDAASFADWP